MVELCIRLLICGATVFVAGLLDASIFEVVWRAAVVVGAVSVVGYLMDKRDVRTPGASGFIAVVDGGAIAAILASAGRLDDFGFLVIAPAAYTVARYGTMGSAIAPLMGAVLLIGSVVVQSKVPTPLLLAQAAAVMLVCLFLNQKRIVVTVTREVEVPENRAVSSRLAKTMCQMPIWSFAKAIGSFETSIGTSM